MSLRFVKATLVGAVVFGAMSASAAMAQQASVGLIVKDLTNPFFVKMIAGAQAEADKLGVKLITAAGKNDADNDGQVAAIENLISAGAKGFAIVPSDSKAIVPTIAKARAAGMVVIDLDTPTDPMSATTATFATNNRVAGNLIGEWAKGTLGDKAASAKIIFLDDTPNQATVDYLRDQGFMAGFGIDVKDPNHIGDENDPRICDHEVSYGDAEKGRTAMENALQKCPDANVVYTINEQAAAGAWEAIKAAGKDKDGILIVSIDGGCPGVKNVGAGVIGATAQQYPLKMAAMAMDAIASGNVPAADPKIGFVDTGAQLVTAKPVDGVPSISVDEGTKLCWG